MRTLSNNTTLQSVIALFMVLMFNQTVLGQNKNLGTAGAQFLKIPVGARAAALGGAVTGLSDDATSLFWNPAGITQDHTHSLHVSQIPWMTYFNITAVGYTINLPQRGTIGFHFRTLGMEKMEITTELEPNGTGEFFDSQDIEVGVSYAVKLIDQFSIGFTSKVIQQRIWNETATAVALDIGTLYHIHYHALWDSNPGIYLAELSAHIVYINEERFESLLGCIPILLLILHQAVSIPSLGVFELFS